MSGNAEGAKFAELATCPCPSSLIRSSFRSIRSIGGLNRSPDGAAEGEEEGEEEEGEEEERTEAKMDGTFAGNRRLEDSVEKERENLEKKVENEGKESAV